MSDKVTLDIDTLRDYIYTSLAMGVELARADRTSPRLANTNEPSFGSVRHYQALVLASSLFEYLESKDIELIDE